MHLIVGIAFLGLFPVLVLVSFRVFVHAVETAASHVRGGCEAIGSLLLAYLALASLLAAVMAFFP